MESYCSTTILFFPGIVDFYLKTFSKTLNPWFFLFDIHFGLDLVEKTSLFNAWTCFLLQVDENVFFSYSSNRNISICCRFFQVSCKLGIKIIYFMAQRSWASNKVIASCINTVRIYEISLSLSLLPKYKFIFRLWLSQLNPIGKGAWIRFMMNL